MGNTRGIDFHGRLLSARWKLKQEPICYYCLRTFEHKELTVDHAMPLIRGGANSEENFRVCCRKCNRVKTDMTETEFVNYIKNYKYDASYIEYCLSIGKVLKINKAVDTVSKYRRNVLGHITVKNNVIR